MRKRIVLLLGLCMVMLSGCDVNNEINSYYNSFIENSVKKESNIEDDADYKSYEDKLNSDKVNPEGYYVSDEVDYSAIEDKDAVFVTFAKNNYLNISYYEDEDGNIPILAYGAYMHADDCIYAELDEIFNPNTEEYKFDGFEVWEFDENGKKKQNGLLHKEQYENDGMVLIFQIPMDFKGNEIAIIPVGRFENRIIELDDYVKDDNGKPKALAGKWIINDIETTDTSANINPVSDYAVKYEYDEDKYDVVATEPEYLSAEDGEVKFEEYSPNDRINKFSVELRRKSNDVKFDPNKYQPEHAIIEFKYQNKIINDPQFINPAEMISYEVISTDAGYYVVNNKKKGEIDVDSLNEVMENLVYKDEVVIVNLLQPQMGGEIVYKVDGKKLDGGSCKLKIGTDIVMEFNSINGWSCEYEDGIKYTVVDSQEQTVNVDGMNVNEVFVERENKPNVTITLDKTVGTVTEFAISTADVNENGLKLNEGQKTSDVFTGIVETKKDLVISASKGALEQGQALKVEVQKIMSDKTKEYDIQYFKKLPGTLTVKLYNADNERVCTTVNVTVSKVEAVAYKHIDIGNGNTSVRTTDLTKNKVLKDGDVIEPSRKIEVSVSANSGYYVKDSGKTDVFTESMKYSKYVQDINNLLDKHKIKKYRSVTLDATDSYGKVVFKVDGKEVGAGTYNLKEEQKLVLSYEITDEKHVIKREQSGWLDRAANYIKSDKKESADIPITSTIDGKTITREDYINIENK